MPLKTRLNRRRFIQFGVGATTALAIPKAFAHTKLKPPVIKDRTLSFYNLHTGESLTASYWADGQYQNSELTAINHILRDFRTGEIHPIDKRLLDLLHQLHHKTDSKQAFQVISGYRSPKTNAALRKHSHGVARHSQHMLGKAIDIRLPDCHLATLRKTAMQCRAGGVGYYPASNFVHVDTGRVRHWG